MRDIDVVLDEIGERQRLESAVSFNGSALDYLQAVHCGRITPEYARMRAAIAALPFESPKLAVTAVVGEKDFASILDARIRHWRSIEGTKIIEQKVERPKPDPEPPKRPLPTVTDRRYRRV
jgi:hypothetical protein